MESKAVFFFRGSGAKGIGLKGLILFSIKCVYTSRNDELEDVSPYK